MTNFSGGTLGERIFRLRQHLGTTRKPLPLQALADRLTAMATERGLGLRYNSTTLQRWEVGQGEPDRETLRTMAQLAGVPVYEFAYGEPERPVADDPPAVAPAPASRVTPPNGGLIVTPGPSIALPNPAHAKPPARRKAGGR